jgi:hypothetical protein
MLAIFTVKLKSKRVHILENNEGLLERDFKTYKPFFDRFNLKSNKQLDLSSDICYWRVTQDLKPRAVQMSIDHLVHVECAHGLRVSQS